MKMQHATFSCNDGNEEMLCDKIPNIVKGRL